MPREPRDVGQAQRGTTVHHVEADSNQSVEDTVSPEPGCPKLVPKPTVNRITKGLALVEQTPRTDSRSR